MDIALKWNPEMFAWGEERVTGKIKVKGNPSRDVRGKESKRTQAGKRINKNRQKNNGRREKIEIESEGVCVYAG